MQKTITISAAERQETGKGVCRRIRKAGRVPGAVRIGDKNMLVEFDAKSLDKAWANDRRFTMDLASKKQDVKIVELQIHPVSRKVLHLDVVGV